MADMDRYWVLKFAFSLSHCVFVPPDERNGDDVKVRWPMTALHFGNGRRALGMHTYGDDERDAIQSDPIQSNAQRTTRNEHYALPLWGYSTGMHTLLVYPRVYKLNWLHWLHWQ